MGEDHPATGRACFTLSNVLFMDGKYQEDLRALNRAERIYRNNPEQGAGSLAMIYTALGAVNEKLGKPAEMKKYAMRFGNLLQQRSAKFDTKIRS